MWIAEEEAAESRQTPPLDSSASAIPAGAGSSSPATSPSSPVPCPTVYSITSVTTTPWLAHLQPSHSLQISRSSIVILDSLLPSCLCIPQCLFTDMDVACIWSFCGRGRCVRTTSLGHRCECKEGFSNLLNHTNLPCLKECLVTADCPNLGFSLSNGSSSPPNFAERSSGDFSARGDFLWVLMIMTCLLVPLRTSKQV